QPARLFNTRNKSKMLSAQRTAKSAGHKKVVAAFAARTRNRTISFNVARNADRNRDGPSRRAGFAANNRQIELCRSAVQTAIKFVHPMHRSFRGDNQRDQRK